MVLAVHFLYAGPGAVWLRVAAAFDAASDAAPPSSPTRPLPRSCAPLPQGVGRALQQLLPKEVPLNLRLPDNYVKVGWGSSVYLQGLEGH